MSLRHTIQDMQELAASYGGKCLSKEYWGKSTPLSWMCKQGHTWDAPPYVIRDGYWCVVCARENEKIFALHEMGRWAEAKGGKCLSKKYFSKIPLEWECKEGHRFKKYAADIRKGYWCGQCPKIEHARKKFWEIQRLAKSKGGKCLSAEYITNHTKLWMQCKEGHRWQATPGNILFNKTWCPFCTGKMRHTISYMRELAAKKGGKCLSRHYINNCTKLDWKCRNGHTWSSIPANIINGKWCPACAGKKKHTLAEAIAWAESKGGKCLSKKYINSIDQKLLWQCSEKHRWEAIFSSVFNNGRWCPVCSRKRLAFKRRGSTIEDMQRIAMARGGKCLSKEYVNQYTHLQWQCSKGHTWQSVPKIVKAGSWCPVCHKESRKRILTK